MAPVVRDDPFQDPGGRHVLRLLAPFVAADVDSVGEDAGGGLKDRPGVARGRDLLELAMLARLPEPRHSALFADTAAGRRSPERYR